jgi:hypothetical protein
VTYTYSSSLNIGSEVPCKNVRKIALFILGVVSTFSIGSNPSLAAGFTTVTNVLFPGGSYDLYQAVSDEGILLEQSFYNFQNNTGIDANDFHATLNFTESVFGGMFIFFRQREINYPTLLSPFSPPFLVPSGAFFSPIELSSITNRVLPPPRLSDIYWTLDGNPLGNPIVPPIANQPANSGVNSYCTEVLALSNSACRLGLVGDVPSVLTRVPEPSGMIGTLLAIGFGFRQYFVRRHILDNK